MRCILYIVLFGLVLFGDVTYSIAQDSWRTLGMVSFNTVYDQSMGMEIKKPIVSPIVRGLNGKEVDIKGYIIPLSGKIAQSHFMLSKYPENMCFFCGAAGPETAMQVFMKGGKKVTYSTEKIAVRGILRVNELDAASLIYTLEDAILTNIEK